MPSVEAASIAGLDLVSLGACLRGRRSRRDLCRKPLSEEELRALCWAGQGITGPGGLRTAPSAGGIHPLELYVVTPTGVLHYEAETDRFARVLRGDRRPELCTAAESQDAVGLAGATVVLVAVEGRMDRRYGARSRRYELVEAGHVGQNILLAATAFHLCASPVGALDDLAVRDVLELPPDHTPLYLITLGRETAPAATAGEPAAS
ncbi:MAG: SagB/ThcOx family dehydrogenase [Candidatus Limnocylindrales bacterium]